MMEMERKMAKRFDDLGLPGWVSNRLRRVLGTDAEVQRLNGASGFSIDMFGAPAPGLRRDSGRGASPPAAQAGMAIGALARNWEYTSQAKDDAIARRPSGIDDYLHHDKFYHCQGNCEAAKVGSVGALTAAGASDYGKEFFDRARGGSVDEADREANRHGRKVGEAGGQCYQGCQHLDREWVVVPRRHRH